MIHTHLNEFFIQQQEVYIPQKNSEEYLGEKKTDETHSHQPMSYSSRSMKCDWKQLDNCFGSSIRVGLA